MHALVSPTIKICGVVDIAGVTAIANAGCTMVGLNLVKPSPRCIDLHLASSLAGAARELGLQVAIVTMNMPASQLAEVTAQVSTDFIQLHGHESPDALVACESIPVIKALSWTGRVEESQLAQTWLEWHYESGRLASFLVDAYAPDQGGGTGRIAKWDLLSPRPQELSHVPMILAGGLKPENVADAIHTTRPDGVDTASGVESSPGKKLEQACHAFVANAREAFGG